MDITTAQAAEILHVSQAEVRRLLRRGELAGRHVGTQWLLDANEVQRRRRLAAKRGRQWSERSALAALHLLGRGDAGHVLSASELSRLRRSLRSWDAADVTRLARGLIEAKRLRVSGPALNELRRRAAEGARFIRVDEDLLGDELLLKRGDSETQATVTVACDEESARSFIRESHARSAVTAANLEMLVIRGARPTELRGYELQRLVAALHLAQHADARVRQAALSHINSAIAQVRSSTTDGDRK